MAAALHAERAAHVSARAARRLARVEQGDAGARPVAARQRPHGHAVERQVARVGRGAGAVRVAEPVVQQEHLWGRGARGGGGVELFTVSRWLTDTVRLVRSEAGGVVPFIQVFSLTRQAVSRPAAISVTERASHPGRVKNPKACSSPTCGARSGAARRRTP